MWFQKTSSHPSSPLKEIFAYFYHLRNFAIIKNLLITSRITSADARSSWGKDAGISWHGCPSRQMSAISSLGPTFSLFAFAYAKGKIHPSKSQNMLIRLHTFKKDRIYPSVYMLILFFFFFCGVKVTFYTISHVQLKFNTIYCLNSLFLKYTSLCSILTPTGFIFWKAFTMAEVAAFSLCI